MRTLTSILLALLVLPAVHADPIVVPGPGSVGTPGFIDIPYTCDPVGLVCVGPVHEPAPAGVSVEADGFVLLVDPAGNPGSVFGPSYHNVTVGDATVPVVLCPNGCIIPATPTADIEGGVSVEVTGPHACTVSLLEPTSVSCVPLGDPVPCDPTDYGGCGLPDPRDHCVREDTDEVPDCFVPVVLGCDPLDSSACVWWLYGLLLDLVFDAVNEALDLVPDPDDLCPEAETFPACLVPEHECVDDPVACAEPPCAPTGLPASCGPFLQAILSQVIPDCYPEPPVSGVQAYACFATSGPGGIITGPLGLRRLVVRDPGGVTYL